MEKTIFIKTFGCQMNEYDSNRIYDSVKKIGFKKTSNKENATCLVLNTCHIRDKALSLIWQVFKTRHVAFSLLLVFLKPIFFTES